MSYHDLSECSLTPDERTAEAERIIKILTRNVEFTRLSLKETGLIQEITKTGNVSVKQLFWLRDIKDKYL